MTYEYGFEYEFPGAMEGAAEGALIGAAGIVAGVLIIIYLLMLGFSVVSYVLNAVGMYRIAKRRGIHHAWLAWIPIGCNWLLGSISDHYQYVAKKKVTNRRKVLLILSIILLVATIIFGAATAGMVISAESTTGEMAGTILLVALMAIAYFGMLGLSIAIVVFCYIAYYDLFQSCKPSNAVLFLVLGVLFSVTLPFFVFACSGSDKGMPERRAARPAAQPSEELPIVEAEPVEEEFPPAPTEESE